MSNRNIKQDQIPKLEYCGYRYGTVELSKE